MPKYRIRFLVEQTLYGSIEIEAESAEAARAAFGEGEYDEPSERCRVARGDARLDLQESEDTILEIQEV